MTEPRESASETGAFGVGTAFGIMSTLIIFVAIHWIFGLDFCGR
jgi:hypothetical protein